MQFQKISIPTQWKVNGNFEGGWQKPKFLKEGMEFNWNFQRGGGIQNKKPSVGGVWIFSGTTQYCPLKINSFLPICLVNSFIVNRQNGQNERIVAIAADSL